MTFTGPRVTVVAAPSAVTDSPTPSWQERVKLLDANYSSDFYAVRVADDGSTVRLEYHLPDQQKLRTQCVVTTVCIGAVFVVCGAALVLFAPSSALGEVFWPAVAFGGLAGTFGPALCMRWRYDRVVQRNPLLEWNRDTNRLSVHRGRLTFDTAHVVGLAALTDPHVDEIPNHTQLQLVLGRPEDAYSELVATSTKPAESVFVPALREFATRTGCPVWVGNAVEGKQRSKFELRSLLDRSQ